MQGVNADLLSEIVEDVVDAFEEVDDPFETGVGPPPDDAGGEEKDDDGGPATTPASPVDDPFGRIVVEEIGLPDGSENTVLDRLAADMSGIVPMESAIKFGEDFVVTTEDMIIFTATALWRKSVNPDWSEVCEQSRLYALVQHALQMKDDDPKIIKMTDLKGTYSGNIWDKTLEQSRKTDSWANLLDSYEKNERAIQSLLTVTTNIDLANGGEIGAGGPMVSLKNELARRYPEYYLCFVCASAINVATAKIQGKGFRKHADKDDIFAKYEPTVWDILTEPQFGLNNAGVTAFIELNARRSNALRTRAIRYVIERLCILRSTLEDALQPPTVFSPISQTLRSYFPTDVVGTNFDPEANAYGSFLNKNAMLAMMLACSELEILQSCASLVKTLVSDKESETSEEELMNIANVLLGYRITSALSDPTSSNNAPKVYSRISTRNLGSLAAVWLAVNAQFTYRQLLTSGLSETQAFNAYSRVCPFVQAVLLLAAQQSGGLDVKASITCDHVRQVFSNYALLLVQTTPAHTEMGTSKMITEIDQQIVTTLFYGALTSEGMASSKESVYLSQLTSGVLNRSRDGDAEVVIQPPGKIAI